MLRTPSFPQTATAPSNDATFTNGSARPRKPARRNSNPSPAGPDRTETASRVQKTRTELPQQRLRVQAKGVVPALQDGVPLELVLNLRQLTPHLTCLARD